MVEPFTESVANNNSEFNKTIMLSNDYTEPIDPEDNFTETTDTETESIVDASSDDSDVEVFETPNETVHDTRDSQKDNIKEKLNQSIKEVYIREKKNRNNTKTKNILGINYDTYCTNDKTKLKRHLMVKSNPLLTT